MTDQTPDIEELLTHLPTQEGKNNALVLLVETGTTTEPRYLERAIGIYETSNRFYDAAQLAGRTGDLERASRLYDSEIESLAGRKMLAEAVMLAHELGKTERVEELYPRLLEHGREKEVGRLLHWKVFPAIRVARELGRDEDVESLYREALADFKQHEDYRGAGRLAEEFGNLDDARFFYEKAGNQSAIARLDERLGRHAEAIAYYEEQGQFSIAAEIATELGGGEPAQTYTFLAELHRSQSSELPSHVRKAITSKTND